MLITFKTSAAPDVMMLEDLAEYLLGIIGKHLSERGVIMHEELPVAIQKLEAAVGRRQEKNAPSTTGVFTKAKKATSRTRFRSASRSVPIRSSTCCALRRRRTPTFSGACEGRIASRRCCGIKEALNTALR